MLLMGFISPHLRSINTHNVGQLAVLINVLIIWNCVRM